MKKVPALLVLVLTFMALAFGVLPIIKNNNVHAVANDVFVTRKPGVTYIDGYITTTEFTPENPTDSRLPTTTNYNGSTSNNISPSFTTTEFTPENPTDSRLTTTPYTTTPSKRISGIYISDMTFVENYDGYWDAEYYWDEIKGDCYYEYYRYNIYPKELTVIYADGTQFTGNVDEVYAETGYWLSYTDNQSYSNQWTVGSYYVSASLGYARTTYKVSIIETPIKSIEFKINKTKLIENIDGHISYYLNEEGQLCDVFFKYDVWVDVTEITFKDGFEHYKDNYGYSLSDNQSYDSPWSVGKHTITFSCLGYEEDFEVEVVSNPNKVVKVSALASRKLVEGFDGYITSDCIFDENTQEYTEVEYYKYFAEHSDPIFTIEFEDGMIVSGTDSEVYKKTGIYPSVITYQSSNDQWEVGTHTAYIEFSNKVILYQLEIIPCPVSKIEFIKAPNKTEYIVGEYPNLDGAIIRIHYLSKDYIDIPLNEHSVSNGKIWFDTHINNSCCLEVENNVFENSGADNIFVTYGQFSCQYPVFVAENKIDKIIINNSQSNELLVTVYNSDGTDDLMKVIAFEPNSSDENGIFEMYGGYLFTDKGIYYSIIYSYHNGLYFIELQNGSNGQMVQSNKLSECRWLELFIKCYKIDIMIINSKTKSFNGEVNKDNIDDIVSLSLKTNIREIDSSKSPFYSSNDIIKAIKNSFVVNDIDLSLSRNYNYADDTIEVNIAGGGAGFIKPHQIKYEAGLWRVELCYFLDEPIISESEYLYIIFDEELRIINYNFGEMPTIDKLRVEITKPTETVISYGDTITLHANIIGTLPKGSTIQWYASNENFIVYEAENSLTYKITPKSSGDTVFTIKVVGLNGEILAEKTQAMTSKASVFDKIIAFFKKLFGLTKNYPQNHKKVS